jgi:hypothetical protein
MKQPRPCTLWGQTFDANDVEGFYICQTNTGKKSVCVELHEVRLQDCPSIETDNSHHEFQSAMHAIVQAKNPLLDLAHAKEIAYEFRVGQRYVFGGNKFLEPFVHEVIESDIIDPSEELWFYPFKEYGQPTKHGEKEAVIKAWEAQKEGE